MDKPQLSCYTKICQYKKYADIYHYRLNAKKLNNERK